MRRTKTAAHRPSCIKILMLLTLLLAMFAGCTQSGELDEEQAAYRDILELTLDADTLQPYYRADSNGTPYPVFIIDDVLSRSEDESGLERFGKPVTFVKRDAAYLPPMEAYFEVSQYGGDDSVAFIQLKYIKGSSKKLLYLDAAFTRGDADWQMKNVKLEERDKIPREEYLTVCEEILRMFIASDGIQDCLTDSGDTFRLPVTFVETDFSKLPEPPSILVYGQPAKFITPEAAAILGPQRNVWTLDLSYSKKGQDIGTVEGVGVELENTVDRTSIETVYIRFSKGWQRQNVFGCLCYGTNRPPERDTGRDSLSKRTAWPIKGLDGYGYVATGSLDRGDMICELVKMGRNALDYEVIDTFTTWFTIGSCGDNYMYYIARDASTYRFITVGPLPEVSRDTVVSLADVDTSCHTLTSNFLDLKDSVFDCQMSVVSDEPRAYHQYFVGKIGSDGLADTVALLIDAAGGYRSPDRTEVFVTTLFDPKHDNDYRRNIGIYDLMADSLLTPLDSDYLNWWPYRASRDEPLYFLRETAERIGNVWRWHEETGEEQITFVHRPEDVKGYELTADSLIYYVGSYGAFYSETDGRRVAIPIDSE